MSKTNLSGSVGLISPIKYMEDHFERVDDGYIAYKVFNAVRPTPDRWDVKPGSVIDETVNMSRTDECGCGINVAPSKWCKFNFNGKIWKVLVRWEWLPGVCVPYNTDGKIRCERVQLLEVVDREA